MDIDLTEADVAGELPSTSCDGNLTQIAPDWRKSAAQLKATGQRINGWSDYHRHGRPKLFDDDYLFVFITSFSSRNTLGATTWNATFVSVPPGLPT